MQPPADNVVRVVGDKEALEELQKDLAADPQLGKAKVSGITETRSRQIGIEDIVFAVALHLPVGVAAHFVHDWLRAWRERRKKNVTWEGGDGI
jgi:hypothetical protein